MEKRIVLPTDFSNNALNAIEYAIDLHKNQKCVFYILNAFWGDKEPTDIAPLIPERGDVEYTSAKKFSEDGLTTLLPIVQLRSKNSKHRYHTLSSYSSLLFALKDSIAKNNIELVVMGTKGTSDEEETLFGSNTLSIMEYITECPILAVPGHYTFSGLKKIVFPTDYEMVFNENKLKYILEIAKSNKSEIQILHIKKERKLDESQEKNKGILESIFKGVAYSFHVLTGIAVNKGIHSFIESETCDLVVFLDEKSNYLGNELPKFLVKEIKSHLMIPVLVINP
ncbi:Nucleotide-binding universal stress protein, UspA family [Maribacter orientalis]|uniref:Nucleotide-binding universal stress protein, UspA family n=1 Tax=Maribacter orientalis TaxID=228957 RepID=A0A1H7F910_9FLAO|nr:universal stress protein [Maribacter orientalis]SEK22184.1 Nucleotide-binding universal stress protein, UspA family [Maribacter orientalis]|tara:strand:- start:788 stop:1633 length:846 start_codon:yes stop_codon:yes gene_type:complete